MDKKDILKRLIDLNNEQHKLVLTLAEINAEELIENFNTICEYEKLLIDQTHGENYKWDVLKKMGV